MRTDAPDTVQVPAEPTAPAAAPLAPKEPVHVALANLAKAHGFTDRIPDLLAAASTMEAGTTLVLDWIRERNAAIPGTRTPSPSTPIFRGGVPREAEQPFASLGDQLIAVVRAERGKVDPRLMRLNEISAASGLSEGVGSEGGFAVQQDFLPGIVEPMYDTGKVLSRCEHVPISEGKNGLTTLEVDETSRATGSRHGGVQMYWAAEGQTKDPSKPKLRPFSLTLKKLLGFWYQTEELTEDAAALGVLAENAFRTETTFMAEDSVFNGDGAGKPLGFNNSAVKVDVAIEAGQTIANTGTHIVANAAKMMSRMPPGLLADAVWFYNPELLPSLLTAVLGQQPVFLPAGGLSGTPYNTLLGHAAFPIEYCNAVGTPGDLVFAALSQYRVIDKGTAKLAGSVHVRFLYGEDCFRITYRMDGAPRWSTSVTPFKGSQARSPFIRLAVRA